MATAAYAAAGRCLPDGATRLALLDAAGVERMRLTLLENGAQGISLADARGEGRVVLSLEGGEGSRLTFADAAGRPRTVLGLSASRTARCCSPTKGGTPRVAIGLEQDGPRDVRLPAERGQAPAAGRIPTATEDNRVISTGIEALDDRLGALKPGHCCIRSSVRPRRARAVSSPCTSCWKDLARGASGACW
jgi:hypothetical protein